MNIIICEGKTDAILLSYFLIKVHNFQHERSGVVKLPEKKGQEINWYRSQNDTDVAIWSADGYSNITYNLEDVIERNVNEPNSDRRFGKIIIYCDRDDKDEGTIIEEMKTWFDSSNIQTDQKIVTGDWLDCTIELKDSSKGSIHINILIVALPLSREGALETFLLDAFSGEGDGEKHVVDSARNYVATIPNDPYLPKNRLREKASLGSVLSVFSPDWVFSELNNRLLLIPWENISDAYDVYSRLGDLA